MRRRKSELTWENGSRPWGWAAFAFMRRDQVGLEAWWEGKRMQALGRNRLTSQRAGPWWPAAWRQDQFHLWAFHLS